MSRTPARFALCFLIAFFILGACSPDEQIPGPEVLLATDTPIPSPTATRMGAPDLSGESFELTIYCLPGDSEEITTKLRLQGIQDYFAKLNDDLGLFGASLELEVVEVDLILIEEGEQSLSLPRSEFPIVGFCDDGSEAALSPWLDPTETYALGNAAADLNFYSAQGSLLSINPLAFAHFLFLIEALDSDWPSLRPLGASDQIRISLFSQSQEFLNQIEKWQGIDRVSIVNTNDPVPEASESPFDFLYSTRDANANLIFVDADPILAAEIVNGINALGLQDRYLLVLSFPSLLDEFTDHIFADEYLEAILFTSPLGEWILDSGHPLLSEMKNDSQSFSLSKLEYYLGIQQATFLHALIEESWLASTELSLNPEGINRALASDPNQWQWVLQNQSQWLEELRMLNQLSILEIGELGEALRVQQEMQEIPSSLLYQVEEVPSE